MPQLILFHLFPLYANVAENQDVTGKFIKVNF